MRSRQPQAVAAWPAGCVCGECEWARRQGGSCPPKPRTLLVPQSGPREGRVCGRCSGAAPECGCDAGGVLVVSPTPRGTLRCPPPPRGPAPRNQSGEAQSASLPGADSCQPGKKQVDDASCGVPVRRAAHVTVSPSKWKDEGLDGAFESGETAVWLRATVFVLEESHRAGPGGEERPRRSASRPSAMGPRTPFSDDPWGPWATGSAPGDGVCGDTGAGNGSNNFTLQRWCQVTPQRQTLNRPVLRV